MYTLAIVPLFRQLKSNALDTLQVWHADDAAAAGKLTSLRLVGQPHTARSVITQLGASFGYIANASKTWLIVKESAVAQARDIFSNTLINITSEGRPYLGAAMGTQDYVNEYVSRKVRKGNKELNMLSTIAATQPHVAFAAFIHGYVHKFCFICRVCPNIEHSLHSLEESICSRFIPAITGRDPPNKFMRDILALPTRLGGMGLVNPVTLASTEYKSSRRVSDPLKNAILEQEGLYSFQCWEAQMDAKKGKD